MTYYFYYSGIFQEWFMNVLNFYSRMVFIFDDIRRIHEIDQIFNSNTTGIGLS